MKNTLLTLVYLLFLISNLTADVINANSGNYTSLLSTLSPGDTLLLASGNYTDRLNIVDLVGTSSQPIVIKGSGDATVFLGNSCCNTVSIKTSAFVTLSNFKIDGQNIQNIDGVKAEGTSGNWAHHIVLDSLFIVGHGGNQQTVGISTKCPTWDWIIRDCTIDAAGTGIYLGNSDGEEPFVNGIVENNLITNTIGYNMQIKHQNVGSRNIPGMTLNGKTIIRHNVLSKENNASSGGSARPNLLVGNFPATGDGANDYYEIYGNFLWQNPFESLFQGTGNVIFYDNIAVNDAGGNGIAIQSQNGFEPREIKVFHNTIVTGSSWGVRLMDTDVAFQKYIYGNLVLSDHSTPIRIVGGGVSTVNQLDNVVDVPLAATTYVNNLGTSLNTTDLFPRVGSPLNDTAIPNALFTTYTDYDLDFNSTPRNWNYRGAYTGEGTNIGWQLAIEKKPTPDSAITGVIEHKSILGLYLYPNPGNGIVSLDFPAQFSTIDITVSNISGIVVSRQNFSNSQKVKLDVSDWVKGIYFINVKDKDYSTTLKLINQ